MAGVLTIKSNIMALVDESTAPQKRKIGQLFIDLALNGHVKVVELDVQNVFWTYKKVLKIKLKTKQDPERILKYYMGDFVIKSSRGRLNVDNGKEVQAVVTAWANTP